MFKRFKRPTRYNTQIYSNTSIPCIPANYYQNIPLWIADVALESRWTKKGTRINSEVDKKAYKDNEQFLKNCLLFSCLSRRNECRSYILPSGEIHQNDLSLNDDTIALRDYSDFYRRNKDSLSVIGYRVLELWGRVIEEARKTANYNPKLKYGPYQIRRDLDTCSLKGEDKRKQYDYPELHKNLMILETRMQNLYHSDIEPYLFEYKILVQDPKTH